MIMGGGIGNAAQRPAWLAGDTAGGVSRAVRRQRIEWDIRGAAYRLMSEQGYEATSTEQIAREAGVSPRTFFNHFPTKESLFVAQDELFINTLIGALRQRPIGEDPVASLSAAIMAVVQVIDTYLTDESARLALYLLIRDPTCQRLFEQRRAKAEQAAWQTFLSRGVSPHDISTRVAVSAIATVFQLALTLWVDDDGKEPLPALAAQCLLALPAPARVAAGIITP